MSAEQIIERGASDETKLYRLADAGWAYTPYECEVRLCKESEGEYSAYVPHLPGVASQGRDETEALNNITEALSAAIRSYRGHDKAIPWVSTVDDPEPGEISHRILVDA